MTQDFYRAFEDKNRGSRELIKGRLKIYLPFLSGLKLVYSDLRAVDLGCGRGEWLELLRGERVKAEGVDLDAGMLAACRDLGLQTTRMDALDYIVAQPDQSVDIISAIHVVEHIPFESLQKLIEHALRVLRPGGLLIMETPNPENLAVGTAGFYMDPTHIRPIPAGLLSYLTEFYGFARHKEMRLQEPAGIRDSRAIRLADVLYGVSPDYAVVAQAPGTKLQLAVLDGPFSVEYGCTLTALAQRFDQGIEGKLAALTQQLEQNLQANLSTVEERLGQAEQDIESKLTAVEGRLGQAEQANQGIEGKLTAVEDRLGRADRIESTLQAVYASKSWRITAPLRKVLQLLIDIRPALSFPLKLLNQSRAALEAMLQQLTLIAMRPVLRRPRLRNRLLARLQQHPGLYHRLIRLAHKAQSDPRLPEAPARHDGQRLTPPRTEQPQEDAAPNHSPLRIVIDLQGAQSASALRGIGRYSIAIAKAIACHHGRHEIFLALNGGMQGSIERIRATFHDLIPQENIRLWYPPGPTAYLDPDNTWRRRSAERVREAFLAGLKPNRVLVTSLFEGFHDSTVTSIGRLSNRIPTAVVLYDLIPLIHRQQYLALPGAEEWYESKLDHLRRADLLLAISESSRQEAIKYLGLHESKVVTISTAAEPQFKPTQIDARREKVIRDSYGLHRPFVMYTGGIDARKNIEGLIRAYAGLPETVRASHQLAVVCAIQEHDRERLESLAKQHHLPAGDLVLTGFVPEEDLIALYNLCKVFVFPSWHEGFGLPALEAMSCGAPTIGANSTSLPEVIGREDALFNPRSDGAITEKLAQVLTDGNYREDLSRHGLKRSEQFSWDRSAMRALEAMEAQHTAHPTSLPAPAGRPKLAYVSPLPPERSGIADYSAELLLELTRHYDIEVIVAQQSLDNAWVKANTPIRTVDWFREHADRYDRVLYHFGNSAYHQHMFALLAAIPGVVVLHDFFLSGVIHHMEAHGQVPNKWTKALYRSHGYKAVQARYHDPNPGSTIQRYPSNLSVLQNALGIIVHSEYARQLGNRWYGAETAADWAVIPSLRVPAHRIDRQTARAALGLSEDAFIVCSFGMLGPIKYNHRLLQAWLSSILAANEQCSLIFVGENDSGEYGYSLNATIRESGAGERIRITGWVEPAEFQRYLAAADVGVQLRSQTRGETSAAALDCMNHGLPLVVNSNGSMGELPADIVWKLPDAFNDAQLVEALECLWSDSARRGYMRARGKEIVRARHAPPACADKYFQAIEHHYRAANTDQKPLLETIARLDSVAADPQKLTLLTQAIAESIPRRYAPRQVLVDISELVQRDAGTGIQRVVRSILREWLENPWDSYRIEPVYATADKNYRYARRFTLRFLDCPEDILDDDPIQCQADDLFIGLDLQPHIVPAQSAYLERLRQRGVAIYFLVYDTLPIRLTDCFVPGAAKAYTGWLRTITRHDGVICISRAVADEIGTWLQDNGPERLRPFQIGWFHLGTDVKRPLRPREVTEDVEEKLKGIAGRNSFLMVGTLEPRKGYAQALAAFEVLWDAGIDVNLVIVGRQGWLVEALVEKIRRHPEFGARLFWLEGLCDEYLEKVYGASTCLIAASKGEGFGLPIIEAAQHGVPIIARDIPVFREVAGEQAYYFAGEEPNPLADTLQTWLRLYESGEHPRPDAMPWLTWKQSAERLKAIIVNDDWYAHFDGCQENTEIHKKTREEQHFEADYSNTVL